MTNLININNVCCVHKLFAEFGDTFAEIGAREPQPRASETLVRFAEYHRRMERQGLMLIKALKPVNIKIMLLLYLMNTMYSFEIDI